MDTIVKFVIDIKMHNDELIEANKKLRRLLKQYIVGEDDIFGIWYKLNYDSVEYGEVKTFFDFDNHYMFFYECGLVQHNQIPYFLSYYC